MKENQLKSYCAPECRLVHVETSSLMSTSFPSQHNPGHHASGPSSAKAATEWEDVEESSKGTSTPWED